MHPGLSPAEQTGARPGAAGAPAHRDSGGLLADALAPMHALAGAWRGLCAPAPGSVYLRKGTFTMGAAAGVFTAPVGCAGGGGGMTWTGGTPCGGKSVGGGGKGEAGGCGK